ncbi:hypothetical protein B0187_05435 [Haemophilus paracuniculus]|uniref:Zinc ribbon domain-containing protein n=1 Tax=Haemophilus paracuniculus TaxID=734 RepID=A0A1T0ASE1_9PAST|nr:zinc ribbon domain-containing protein [Haemophilus paracuniculus]OOR99201.1 hypothetical protein B0187_05435 [Haemophilus paracuniculus]
MALINCPECNHQVSDQALKCTSCGKQLKKPKRSFLGKIIKWIFILFNLLMIFWVVGGSMSAGDTINSATSEAAKAGATIGAGLGLSMVLGLWVIGDIIIGILVFLTRPKS